MRLRATFQLAVVTVLAFLLGAAAAWAQSQAATESALKAAFIFKFASFVEWPAGTFTRVDQPLVMAVSGDAAVAADLEQQLVGRSIDGHPAIVKRIVDNAVPVGAHIVFFGARRDARLREAIEATLGPVLIVTEQANAHAWGSILNFSMEGARVRFSASPAAAEARGLRLSARLLSVAHSIEGRSK